MRCGSGPGNAGLAMESLIGLQYLKSMPSNRPFAFILVLVVLTTSLSGGELREPYDLLEPVAQHATGSDGWEFTVGAFGWFSSINGVSGPAGMEAPVDIEFGEILENLDMVFLANAEARRGRFALYSTVTYLAVSASEDSTGPLFTQEDVDLEQIILDVRLAYRFLEGRTTADAMIGARYMAVDTEIDFSGGDLGDLRLTESQDWLDPLVELRLAHQFDERWAGVIRGNVGGFGVSSELAWELFGGISYQLKENMLIYGGYRYLNVDYDRSFVFDMEVQGIVLGAEFAF